VFLPCPNKAKEDENTIPGLPSEFHFFADDIQDLSTTDFPLHGYELHSEGGEIHVGHPELPEEMTLMPGPLCFSKYIHTPKRAY